MFLTHFFSEHTVGILDLWLTGWLGGQFGGRSAPFHLIGPSGTKDLMTNLEHAYAADIRIRIADEHFPPRGVQIITKEFKADGGVYEKTVCASLPLMSIMASKSSPPTATGLITRGGPSYCPVTRFEVKP